MKRSKRRKRRKVKNKHELNKISNFRCVSSEKRLESLDSYELQREGTLVTQAGLITAVFSFSTTALFTVWQIGLAELDRIPDMWIHLCMGIITFFLLLSMLEAVRGLYIAIYTNGKKEISTLKIQDNNNKIVRHLRKAIRFFMHSIIAVFIGAIFLGTKYYFPILWTVLQDFFMFMGVGR